MKQPVPSNEGWDTQQSKVLQGLEHVLGRREGERGGERRGEFGRGN